MKVLADTSVWIEHFRSGVDAFTGLLCEGVIHTHPMVVGELVCGHLPKRESLIGDLKLLPGVEVATHEEVLTFVERRKLMGRGLGLVDLHLLASTLITPTAVLWTLDQRLAALATEMGVAFPARC